MTRSLNELDIAMDRVGFDLRIHRANAQGDSYIALGHAYDAVYVARRSLDAARRQLAATTPQSPERIHA